jgi:hypothetical protein
VAHGGKWQASVQTSGLYRSNAVDAVQNIASEETYTIAPSTVRWERNIARTTDIRNTLEELKERETF